MKSPPSLTILSCWMPDLTWFVFILRTCLRSFIAASAERCQAAQDLQVPILAECPRQQASILFIRRRPDAVIIQTSCHLTSRADAYELEYTVVILQPLKSQV